MSILLWLYPRDWRRRYGAEMRALLQQLRRRGQMGLALDLLRGAADAHLHPQWPRRRRPRWLPVALGLLVAALASHAVAVSLGAADALAISPSRSPHALLLVPSGQFPSAWALAVVWLGVALAWRWLGTRALALFAALLAVRFAADWFLLGVAVAVTHNDSTTTFRWIVASGVELGLWGGLAVLVLRGTRLAWPLALAAGCLLELLLGSSGLSLVVSWERSLVPVSRWRPERWDWSYLPGYLEPLRVVLWAATLTWLSLLRRPRPGPEPPEGAPVAARPAPPSPEPLQVRDRRAS